jgi:hypothetical protein
MSSEPCKGCGGPRPPFAVAEGDDFCSTECARRHYRGRSNEANGDCHGAGAGRYLAFWRWATASSNVRKR